MPILIFIGIEITAQSFHVTPRRHYAALAVACLPALAKLIVIYLGQHVDPEKMATNSAILNLKVLSGGFIISSLLWASALAKIIDRRYKVAAMLFAIGGVMVLFGVVHSPLDDKMFLPTEIFLQQTSAGRWRNGDGLGALRRDSQRGRQVCGRLLHDGSVAVWLCDRDERRDPGNQLRRRVRSPRGMIRVHPSPSHEVGGSDAQAAGEGYCRWKHFGLRKAD